MSFTSSRRRHVEFNQSIWKMKWMFLIDLSHLLLPSRMLLPSWSQINGRLVLCWAPPLQKVSSLWVKRRFPSTWGFQPQITTTFRLMYNTNTKCQTSRNLTQKACFSPGTHLSYWRAQQPRRMADRTSCFLVRVRKVRRFCSHAGSRDTTGASINHVEEYWTLRSTAPDKMIWKGAQANSAVNTSCTSDISARCLTSIWWLNC